MHSNYLARSIQAAALVVACLPTYAGTLPVSFLGEPAPADKAQRTIAITPTTTYVAVVSGETVKFVIGDKTVAWHFDGPAGPFNLAQIMPVGTLDHSIRGEVAINPLYWGSQ